MRILFFGVDLQPGDYQRTSSIRPARQELGWAASQCRER